MSDLINQINNLPYELIYIIKEYIPVICLVFVNKTNYVLYHSLIKNYIPKYENYIRDIIRRDYSFVFETILKESIYKWFEITNYIYKNMVFKNYSYFVIYYCIENDSSRCRNLINFFLKELGLGKNQHKKNIVKYIKWKN